MATGDTSNTLESCLKLLNSNTSHPEQFLSLQDALAADFTSLTKTLYDLHKAQEPTGTKGSPLAQLVVENFDEEQIWQELELQNTVLLKHFEGAVSQAAKDPTLCVLEEEDEESDDHEVIDDDDDDDEEEEEDEEIGHEDQEEEEEEEEKESEPKVSMVDEGAKISDEDSDVDFDVDALERQTKQQKHTAVKPPTSKSTASEVDDRFFKLSEMEAFLEDMEKREEKGDEGDEHIDYFQDLPSGDDEELTFDKPAASKSQKKLKSSRNMKYKDFFDSVDGELAQKDPDEEEDSDSGNEVAGEEGMPDDDGEEEDEDEEDFDVEGEDANDAEIQQARDALRKVTFDLPGDDGEGEDVEDIFGRKAPNASKPEAKSAFEKRQDKMAVKIQELEKAALGEKPWQLTGEVTAQTRPENSMLEEDLSFEQASRNAPAVTEETTLQLEDIIKQRIKDQVWDDVVRKEKPKEEVFEYKKRLTLDHEKSKLSLAEVYEQEYLKQTQEKTEEVENPAHVEIQKLMDTLFLKLDALSNFHFTPKPPVAEMKVISNLPSISMEEVAPINASNATLLAPEEIKEKNKAGDVLGDSEKTATDKNRERRKKKVVKRLKIQEREKRQKLKAAKAGANQKQTRAEVADTLKKLAKGGKATILTDDGMDKALRSSQAFFSQLQDQVKTQIKGSKDPAAKKKKQKQLSASKLKL